MTTTDHDIGTTVADQSLRIATALSAEVVVLRERVAIMERMLAAHGLFGPAEIDAYQPAADIAEAFKAERKGFLQRVFGAMRA